MRINLAKEWQIRSEPLSIDASLYALVLNKKDWLYHDLPCDIHMPLLENGFIEEPLEAENCFLSEWTEKKSWWFKKTFILEKESLSADVLELEMESLDSHADIILNGIHIGRHKSAFYPFKKDIKKLAHEGKNVLIIRLTSGLEHYNDMDTATIGDCASPIMEVGGGIRGDKRRIFVRKPQYVYGWDWGPRVATCGIMKGAWINVYNEAAIRNVHVMTESINTDAMLKFEVEIENFHYFKTKEAVVCIEIFFDDKQIVKIRKDILLTSGISYHDIDISISDAKLWWPNGMGKQSLYDINVKVITQGIEDSYKPFKYGIRTLSLDQTKINSSERLFAFEINGVKTFCKGGNWIPADSIYARVSDEKYDTLISEAKDANFNMLRIWGGGIYERDIFYEKCNEYGILVWQDFMFVCALYPDNLDWFCNEVKSEMDYQTKRLRNHPSLALWCGNNEIHWGFDEWYTSEIESSFPGGAVCYNEIAPRIVRDNCPETPYWNSSPYGSSHPNGNDMGDRHHWHDCTMNEDMEKRITPEEYDKISSKFISEYGYIGPSKKSSIIKYHGGESLDRKGPIWQLHNNTFEKETVPAGIAKHYTDPDRLDIDEYLLYAGLCQGLMYNYSLEAIRFKQNCGGSLFWMYNDCWGEVGWTILDYYLERKISYYFVKRAFEPQKLIMRENDGGISVIGINESPDALEFEAEYGYIRFDGKNKITAKTMIKLKPFSRGAVLTYKKEDYDYMVGISFIKPISGITGINPATLRQKCFKELNIPKSDLSASDISINNGCVSFTVTSSVYAHAVHFGLSDDIKVSDEYFDLLPGEKRQITISNIGDDFKLDCLKPRSLEN